MKIDELALKEASAKLLRLRLTDVGGRKERPSETVKSVLKRGLGGMYDDQAVMYILRHGLQYYQSAQQSRAADAPKSVPVCTCSMDDGIHEWNCALESARR